MDVSHFGLFDVTGRQPQRTGSATAVSATVANDNAPQALRRPPSARTRNPIQAYRSLWRLVLPRSLGTEPR